MSETKTPGIKGIGKFIPISKIKEITDYFDSRKLPIEGEDPSHAEGYAWIDTITKFSVLGDTSIPEKIIEQHNKKKSLMEIHKSIKKMEDGGQEK